MKNTDYKTLFFIKKDMLNHKNIYELIHPGQDDLKIKNS